MTTKKLIKICGIQQAEMAYAAARAGADFIGIVLAPSSSRCVSVGMAVDIARQARAGGAEPVAVFANADAAAIQRICTQADIQYVQLHGDTARQQAHLLPAELQRIYACRVSANGDIHKPDLMDIKHLISTRDYLLFDGMQAGSGKHFVWENFTYAGEFRWFLSGGLRCDNVATALKQLNPAGVDVSSGVENSYDNKSIELIKQFIAQVKERLSE